MIEAPRRRVRGAVHGSLRMIGPLQPAQIIRGASATSRLGNHHCRSAVTGIPGSADLPPRSVSSTATATPAM